MHHVVVVDDANDHGLLVWIGSAQTGVTFGVPKVHIGEQE
jgi:hypothetical protein